MDKPEARNPTRQRLPAINPPGAPARDRLSRSGPQIKEKSAGNEDLRLDCKLEGTISLGGFRLTVGSSSHVDGDITAREVIVSGEVKGNINARDRLEIKKGSSVAGDLSTARIIIEEFFGRPAFFR